MSFWLVQIVSVVGVAAVIALTWLVGWGKRARIASTDQAAARFRADFSSADVKAGVVGRDGRAAVLDLGKDIGLVTVLGDELVTRRLRAGEAIAKTGPNGLVLELPDPTLPRVRISLDGDEIEQWARLFAPPFEGEAGSHREPGEESSRNVSTTPSLAFPLEGGGESLGTAR